MTLTLLLLACAAGTIDNDDDDANDTGAGTPWGWDGGGDSGDGGATLTLPERGDGMPPTIDADDTGETGCVGGTKLAGNFDVQLQGAALYATALFGDAGICADVECPDAPWLAAWVAHSGACSDPDGAAVLPATTTVDGALAVCWQAHPDAITATSTGCTLDTTAGVRSFRVTLTP